MTALCMTDAKVSKCHARLMHMHKSSSIIHSSTLHVYSYVYMYLYVHVCACLCIDFSSTATIMLKPAREKKQDCVNFICMSQPPHS